MKDAATLRVLRRTSSEVERKLNCVQALKRAQQTPVPALVDDLRADEEFLEYMLGEVFTR
jgi:hypothetical protein